MQVKNIKYSFGFKFVVDFKSGNSIEYKEVVEWCKTTLRKYDPDDTVGQENWKVSQLNGEIYFVHESDAALFLLRWNN